MSEDKRKLVMQLPEGFADALSRRHHGAIHTEKEILDCKELLDKEYKTYKKYKAKHDHLLNVEWDEKRIEANFGRPIFYAAHRKLKRYENKLCITHKFMFRLLTHFDGLYDQEFNQFHVISPDDIMYDFECKYLNLKPLNQP